MGNIRKHGMELIEHKIIQKEKQVQKARACMKNGWTN